MNKLTLSKYLLILRMVGLEPTRGRPRKILSLVRLPFRHIRMCGREKSLPRHSLSYHAFPLLSNTFFEPDKYPDKNQPQYLRKPAKNIYSARNIYLILPSAVSGTPDSVLPSPDTYVSRIFRSASSRSSLGRFDVR